MLISKNTDQAYYQREEIANAIAMARKAETEHRVVPVYVDTDGEEEVDTPYGLRLKHSVKLSKVGGVDGLARKLLELLDQVKALASPKTDINTLPEKDLGALFVLQQVPQGVPAGVLCEAVGIDDARLCR